MPWKQVRHPLLIHAATCHWAVRTKVVHHFSRAMHTVVGRVARSPGTEPDGSGSGRMLQPVPDGDFQLVQSSFEISDQRRGLGQTS